MFNTRRGELPRQSIFSIEPARRVINIALVSPFLPGTTAALPSGAIAPGTHQESHETDP
jgi:hypothetical protein